MTSAPGLLHRWTVADVMTTRVHVASSSTPFKQLVRLIEENRISALPVVDQAGIPIGVVSEADLLLKERRREIEAQTNLLHPRQHRAERAKAEGTVAADLMTSPPLTVRTGATLVEAAGMMQKRNVRRLVVVDDRGKIAGMVSRSDLLQVFLRTDDEIRDEITEAIIPGLLVDLDRPLDVAVRFNVVTMAGTVSRRTDMEILIRLIREMDGVVEVVNRLSYAWDDGVPVPQASATRPAF